MKRLLTAHDILSDIEFELAQGSISRDDLGEGIQAVKQYQNKLRGEVFLSARPTIDGREIVSRQFQINDMHVALIQEMAAAIQSLQLDLRRLGEVSRRTPSAFRVAPSPPTAVDLTVSDDLDEDRHGRPTTDVENAMGSKALHVGLDVRPVNAPIVGGLLRRLRVALHSLSIFYVNRLASEQAAVNRTYGDWILYLARLCQEQREEISALASQVISLQNRLAELERLSPRSADQG